MTQKRKSKGEYLVELAQLGMGKAQLLLKAQSAIRVGEHSVAISALEEFIKRGRLELDLTLEHNQSHPPPLEVPPVVGPLVNTLLQLADLLEQSDGEDGGASLRTEALALADTHLGEAGYMEALRWCVASLQMRGRFNEAMAALIRIRDSAEEGQRPLTLATATLSLVEMLQWLGDFSRARRELDRAAAVLGPLLAAVPTEDRAVLDAFAGAVARGRVQDAQDLVQLRQLNSEVGYYRGLMAMHVGNHEEARVRFAEVLPAYRGLGVGTAIEVQLAILDVRDGVFVRGLDLLHAIEPEFRRPGPLSRRLPVLLRWRGEALLGREDIHGALAAADEAIALQAPLHDADALWRMHWLRGRCLARVGDARSLDAYSDACGLIDSLRKAPLGYRLDSAYLRDKLPYFDDAVHLACEQRDGTRCAQLTEVVKARILTSTLSVPRPSQGSSAEERKVEELNASIDAMEFAAFRDGGWSEDQRAKHQTALVQRRDLLERLHIADPRWRSMTQPSPLRVDAIQRLMASRGDAALGLFRVTNGVAAVLIDGGGCIAALQPVAPQAWSAVLAYAHNLQSDEPVREQYDPSALGLTADSLVTPPLLDRALLAKRIVVVPHRELHLLPWGSMVYHGARLFESSAVGVLPNFSCIATLAADFSSAPRLALIGAPEGPASDAFGSLPGAAAEIADLAREYPSRLVAPPVVGPAAREATFWSLAKHPHAAGAILHVACHATFDAGDPMNSALFLVDGRADGVEIANSRVDYDEVVLSACSTGVRALAVDDMELTGDDIVGLPGAFLEAGARSILVSISEAADLATTAMMSRYYRERMAGRPPLVALQSAQKAMFGEGEFPVFHWIGFTAYGAQ